MKDRLSKLFVLAALLLLFITLAHATSWGLWGLLYGVRRMLPFLVIGFLIYMVLGSGGCCGGGCRRQGKAEEV